MISVENATLDDCAAIAAIHTVCWKEVYSFIPDDVHSRRSYDYRFSQWQDVFRKPRAGERLFVVKSVDRTVGFAFVKENAETCMPTKGELHAAYVLKAFRGGVVGPMLMLHMIRDLRSNDLAPIGLWAFKQNRVRLWYSALGWEPIVDRDRLICGVPVPETGFVHKDLDKLEARLERLSKRGTVASSRLRAFA